MALEEFWRREGHPHPATLAKPVVTPRVSRAVDAFMVLRGMQVEGAIPAPVIEAHARLMQVPDGVERSIFYRLVVAADQEFLRLRSGK